MTNSEEQKSKWNKKLVLFSNLNNKKFVLKKQKTVLLNIFFKNLLKDWGFEYFRELMTLFVIMTNRMAEDKKNEENTEVK